MNNIGNINNGEQGISARTKLNEAILEANKVVDKVEKNPGAVPGNVAVWGAGGVLLDGGVTPGGGEQVNVPDWSGAVSYPLGFVVKYSGRLFSSKVADNLGNVPPTEGQNLYWLEVSESQASGTPVWQAGTFLQDLAEVYYFDGTNYNLYVLREPVPFISADFAAELAAGSWQIVGGGGSGGTTDHSQLTVESRALPNQHPIGAITGLVEKHVQLDAKDDNLQHQIIDINVNSPISIVRFFTRNQATLSGQLVYLSSETKGTNPTFVINTAVTGTNRATANTVGIFAGDTPLTVERELSAQNAQLFVRSYKNNTPRIVNMYIEFYDYSATGVLTLKGSTSDFVLTDAAAVYNLLLQIEAYTAQIGARSWVVVKTYQTGTGTAAQANLSIEGDYLTRFQYNVPAGSLSFLDNKVVSTQDLPSRGLLSGATQKEVNKALANPVERGIPVDGISVDVVRDYYSAEATISEIIGRGVTLIERSTDNITFITATPPFNVTGDVYWRITPNTEKSFVKIKGQLV